MRGAASVSEIAKPYAMTLPAVVHHLQTLEASGLIRSEKLGRVRTCRIEPAAMLDIERWVAARRRHREQRLDRLQDWLGESNDRGKKRAQQK